MTPAHGTAHSCWLKPRPHDPLRCGLNSSLSYADALCNLPQFANFPQGMHGVALLLHCLAISRSTLEEGCRLSSRGMVPRLGGWGTIFFPGRLCFEGRYIIAGGAQGPTLPVSGRTPGGCWCSPAAQAQRARSLEAAETAVGQHASAG